MSRASLKIHLRDVPALRGVAWVRQGFAVFFARPMAFLALMALLLIYMLATRLLPLIGPFLFDFSLPLVSLGFMLATQETLQGRSPSPRVFSHPLRVDAQRRRELFKLGGLYALSVFIAMLLSHWIDGGQMAELQADMLSDDFAMDSLQARLNDPQLMMGMLCRMGLSSLVSLAFWHTAALTHWGGQTAAKSLFFNAVALWRARAAFTVYGLVATGILLGFTVLGTFVLMLLGQSQQLMGLVFMPGVMMLATVFYASLFFTFADSFKLSETVDASASPPL